MSLFTSLRYLVALHQHRHFGRAADACHITQPTLSNALRALEEEFGTPIVKRGRAFESFTPEGERIVASAQRLLHEQELLWQDLRSAEADPVGALKLGAVPSVMPIAARFVGLLRARHPGLTITLRSMSSPEIEAGLEELSVDLALGYTERLKAQARKITQVEQYTERYFLLRRRADPALANTPASKAATKSTTAPVTLSASTPDNTPATAPAMPPATTLQIVDQPLSWKAASMFPLCLLTPEMHNRAIVDASFARADAQPIAAIETNSILTLGLSVLVGDVCSVLPGALVSVLMGYGELEAVPLTGPEVLTPIGFMHATGQRPSHALRAALALAGEASWHQHMAAHSGALHGGVIRMRRAERRDCMSPRIQENP